MALRAEAPWLSRDWPPLRAQGATLAEVPASALVTQPERLYPPFSKCREGHCGTTERHGDRREIVSLDASGKPSFNLLQGFGGGASAIVLGSGAFKVGK